ncbi:MAG: hypothetical protein JO271_17760 [Verrucomicrobia bacterium]|nr:hypothetical protein [Verrucomicrobiota bacterium]MBV9272442.1 hypothetical protein [Verrucomicrobiota bacterium]
MKQKLLILAAIVGLGATVTAFGDEVQFVTLPQVVRTAVVRVTNIPDYSRVTRVVQDQNGVYEVTVRRDSDNDILFVNPEGQVVRQQVVALNAPVTAADQSVTQTVTVEQPTVETFVRALDSGRYQLVEKKRNKEVYVDRQTGEHWTVRVEKED